jgi:hypothetical protein
VKNPFMKLAILSFFILLRNMGLCAEEQTARTPEQIAKDAENNALRERYALTNWETGGYPACLTQADCEPLVACPANRACFNSCNIGYDSGKAGKAAGGFFAGMFGVHVESDYHVMCLADCIQNKDKDCAKAQPVDITKPDQAPAMGDPYTLCMQYCDGYSNGWCNATCVNLKEISKCFQDHSADNSIETCSSGQYENLVASYEMFWNEDYVHKVIRSFVWDARCFRKPEIAGCVSLCDDFPGLTRVCRDRIAKVEAGTAEMNKQATVSAEAASSSGEAAVGTTKDTNKSVDSQEERINRRLAEQAAARQAAGR